MEETSANQPQPQVQQPTTPQNSPLSATGEEDSGFFQEANGTYSSMRLMCFIAILAAIVFGLLTILLAANGKSDGSNGIYITFGFLISAFAPKAVQKFAEQKIPAMAAT
jgi:hypothetical protein